MCKYCKNNFDNKQLMYQRINLGFSGELIFETKIERTNTGQLITQVTFLHPGCVNDYMGTIKRNIKYCPMCGRKL